MRAAVMRDKKIVVDTVPEPEPGPGQVLVKTLACGICGSDLHMLKFADRMVEIGRRSGTPGGMDPTTTWSWATSSVWRCSTTARTARRR